MYESVESVENARLFKERARYQTMKAIKRGEVKRLSQCEGCSDKEGIQAHHRDYSKPLEVKWLCESCHRAEHTLLRLLGAKLIPEGTMVPRWQLETLGEVPLEVKQHGKFYSYFRYKCRCERCHMAARKYYRSAQQEQPESKQGRKLRRSLATHGTLTRYATQGCRCTKCRKASAAYKRQYRLAQQV